MNENNGVEVQEVRPRKPDWLRVKLPTGESFKKVREIVSEHKLHTICQSGNCPNMGAVSYTHLTLPTSDLV